LSAELKFSGDDIRIMISYNILLNL